MKPVLFGTLLLLASCIFAAPTVSAPPQSLHKTAVGRFGAGHKITANTASQDLLTWNINNTGKHAEVRLYDENGTLVSLGQCGLPFSEGATIRNEVRDIGWTQLTSRYISAEATVDVLESILTPVLFFRTVFSRLALFQPGNAPLPQQPQVEAVYLPLSHGMSRLPAEGYHLTRDGKLTRPYFIATVKKGKYRASVICLLNHNPATLTVSPLGLGLTWETGSARPYYVGLLPLENSIPVPVQEASGVAKAPSNETIDQIDRLVALLLRVPTSLTEAYSLTDKSVRITNKVSFAPFIDDWGWSRRIKGYVALPSALSNARRYGYPLRSQQPILDMGYPLFLSPLDVVQDTDTLTYELPRPDIYGTITSPFRDPQLDNVLPKAVRQTVQDYSRYITHTYSKKTDFMYGGSAIGEGRILSSEYSGYRMMTPGARKPFDRYADLAASKKLYNWAKCYNYGTEIANGQRFLLDNYRIGGQDYIDAGWFGYSVTAMWARAHYGNHWSEIKQHWTRIRELFYGWNWVYSDYAAMHAPLYVDANNGGNPKGYTDNMSMLPALYAWARMADYMGDTQTLNDALYMLARDRVARFGRMAVYAYANSIGYKTDVTYLVSDMGNGPNIAPQRQVYPTGLVSVEDRGPRKLWRLDGGSLVFEWFLLGASHGGDGGPDGDGQHADESPRIRDGTV